MDWISVIYKLLGKCYYVLLMNILSDINKILGFKKWIQG